MVEVQSHCTSNLVWRLNLTHPFAAYVSAGRESDASFHFVCSICFQLTAKPQTVAVTHDMAVQDSISAPEGMDSVMLQHDAAQRQALRCLFMFPLLSLLQFQCELAEMQFQCFNLHSLAA